MKILGLINVGTLSSTFMSLLAAILSGGYDLIIIDDGDVPLAGGIHPTNYYVVMLSILLIIVLIAVSLAWLAKRSTRRTRLLELWSKQSKTGKVPFFIKDINSEINIAEDELAAEMVI